MSRVTSTTTTTPYLTEGNYLVWYKWLRGEILTLGHMSHLQGKNPEPAPITSSSTAEERRESREWNKGQDATLGTIEKSISDANARLIDGMNAHKAWKKLEATHAGQDSHHQFSTLQQLALTRQKSAETLTTFHQRVQLRVDELVASIPSTMTIAEFASVIGAFYTLNNLLPNESNESLGQLTNFAAGAGAINMTSIAEVFLREQGRRTQQANKEKEASLAAQAYSASTSRSTPSGGKLSKPKGAPAKSTCQHCQKAHPSDDCYKKYPEKRPDWMKTRDAEREKVNAARRLTAGADAAQEEEEEEVAHAASASLRPSTATLPTNHEWNTDTGASSSMTPHRHWIRDMKTCRVPVRVATGEVVYATGRGDVLFHPKVDGSSTEPVVLTRVLYVPALSNNLLALLPMTRDRSVIVTIDSKGLRFVRDGETLLTASYRGKAAFLDGSTIPLPEFANTVTSVPPMSLDLLHRRIAHLGGTRLKEIIRKGMVKGIKFVAADLSKDASLDGLCEPCLAGKQKRDPFPTSDFTTSHPLELVVSDLHGPVQATDEGFKYWCLFLDVHTRFLWIYLLKRKKEAFPAYREWKALAEKQSGHKLKRFRDDKGGEYIGKKWEEDMKADGVMHDKTTPDTPQQNGLAERKNGIIKEGITSMLAQAKLPAACWGQAIALLVRIINASPTSALPDKTPYEAFFGRKPDVSMLRTFGCRAYVQVQKKKREHGLGWHTERCVYFGFEDGYKGFKCFNPETNKFVISRDVVFDENDFPGIPWLEEDEPFQPISGGYYPAPVMPAPAVVPGAPAAPPAPPAPPAPGLPPPAPAPSPPSTDSDSDSNPPRPPPTRDSPPDPNDDYRPTPDSPSEDELTPPRKRSHKGKAKHVIKSEPSSPEAGPSRPHEPRTPKRKGGKLTRERRALMRDPWSADVEADVEEEHGRDDEEEEAPEAPVPFPSVSPGPERRYPGRQRGPPTEYWKLNKPALPPRFDGPAEDDDSPPPEGGDGSASDEADIAFRAMEIVYPSVEYLSYEMALEMLVEDACAASTDGGEPKSFHEAMARPDKEKWLEAALVEMQAHLLNGTWKLVEPPKDRKAIGSRWVFKVKRDASGNIERYKARLVAKGFSQRPGLDYHEVFAPTMRWASIRLILALAALGDWEVESLDVSNAYLNGVLPDDIAVYMQQPEGFENAKYPQWVCRLVKGLYGMKQAGRLWYQKLGEVLDALGFRRLVSDPSIYIWEKEGIRVILPAFVDDLTLVSKSKALIQETKAALSKAFRIRDLGPISFLLGVHITRDRANRSLSLSQRQYILDLLERFGMANCATVTTPMEPGLRLTKAMSPSTPAEIREMQGVPYLEAVGALNYLAIGTRPDISYTVGKLARFNSNPGPAHWDAVKHLLRYLKGTADLKLTYSPSSSPEMFDSFSDADHAGNPDNGRSTTGYFLKMGTGAISWGAKLQTIVAKSTTEAEYVAASSAGSEMMWLRMFLEELGYSFTTPSTLLVDNNSAVQVANNPEHHGRMKQLDVHFFWLRDAVEAKTLAIKHLPGKDQPADLLTKPLPLATVQEHRKTMGLM